MIIYARKDKELVEQLDKHLTPLKRKELIEVWYGEMIEAGEVWDEAIRRQLDSAEIFLLMVSSDFISSQYIYDVELKAAMERQRRGEARVIPVILRSCMWQKEEFGVLQALPGNGLPVVKWGDRDEAFTNIVQGIQKVL